MFEAASAPTHELLRSKDGNWIKEVCFVLNKANIFFSVVQTKVVVDLDNDGAQNLPAGDVSILIPPEHWTAARTVYESYVQAYELPELHFLRNATDEDLINVLAEPDEWNGFDVARARWVARQRGLNAEAILRERVAKLSQGIPASRWMLTIGWLTSFTILCLPIAFSLVFKKTTTTHGEFYVYDKPSRDQGIYMFIVQVCLVIAYTAAIAFGLMNKR